MSVRFLVGRLKGNAEARFLLSIGDRSDCWQWLGVPDRTGYGRIKVNGRHMSAHRYSWVLHNGEIPSDMLVCHTCDNRTCVNPNHLFLGSVADNNNDAAAKGRTRGAGKYGTAMTAKVVEAIRRAIGTQKEIAERFGVCQATVHNIKHGKHWTVRATA